MSADLRAAIIAEALTWTGTKYHHQAGVKGAGVDCLMLIVRVGQAVGIIDQGIEIPPYSTQFNLHHSAETYLEGLLGYMQEVETPKPADIAIWQFGRCFSHAGIVIDWPTIIHASSGAGYVITEDVETARWLSFVDHKGSGIVRRPVKFLSLWP